MATYAEHVSPSVLGEKLLEVGLRYDAMFVIEQNGVGEGPIAYVMAKGAGGRLLGDKRGALGFTTTAKAHIRRSEAIKLAIADGQLVLRSQPTLRQIATYRAEKVVEMTPRQEILQDIAGTRGRKRRARHHWDRVSALLLLPDAAMQMRCAETYDAWEARKLNKMLIFPKARRRAVQQGRARYTFSGRRGTI